MVDGGKWQLGRRPVLDAVRGLAILLVLLGHSWLPSTGAAGAAGVTLFFTLSGFLITVLLVDEHSSFGRIGITGFYIRRARRLLPALFASTMVVALASIVIGSWFFHPMNGLAVAGYVGNWIAMDHSLGGLAGTWSLAVEEQFYLVWPVVMMLCLRRGIPTLAFVTAAAVAASAAWREHLITDGASDARIYYGSDTRADALLVGCLLALLLSSARARPAAPRFGIIACAGIVLTGLLFEDGWVRWVPLLVPALSAAAIWLFVRGEGLGSPRWLRWFGTRAYGIYLWHCPVSAYMTLAHPDWSWPVRTPIILLVGLPLAEISWRYIEQPFLRRHEHPGQTAAIVSRVNAA